MALRAAGLAGLLALAACPAQAQPAAAAPAPASPAAVAPEPDSDTWIFSGMLEETKETFSGTLITGKADTQFELKLAGGATCDGGDLKPSMGLVRLSEIACSDGRSMRALFVPQARQTLKVFGHVGDARFATIAHLLGTQPLPRAEADHRPRRRRHPSPPTAPPAQPGRARSRLTERARLGRDGG